MSIVADCPSPSLLTPEQGRCVSVPHLSGARTIEMTGMSGRNRALWLGVVGGGLGALVLLGVIGLSVVYTGAYNIAATEEHTSLTRWAFDTTFRNSVERQAADVAVPDRITPDMVAAGASSYKTMCQHCHAGPGVERAKWASGMRPRPPHLTERASGYRPQEVFWLVKHGARMTGMPAFGPTHDDQTLWSITAFVKELPGMTPERYAELGTRPQAGEEAQGGSPR